MAKGQKRSNRETKKPKTSTKKQPATAQLANQPFQKKFEPGRKAK